MGAQPPADSRVVLGIPSRGQMASHTGRTLLDVAHYDGTLGRGWLNKDKPTVWVVGASLIVNARNSIVDVFLKMEDQPEWLLFLDDDQLYPPDLLEHLMVAVEEVERQTKQSCLTMGVPVWRLIEVPDTERRGIVRSTHNVFDLDDDGKFVEHQDVTPDRVMQVAGIGAGCLMIHRYALERVRAVSAANNLGAAGCWFRHVVWPVNEGEDVYFCRMLAAAGVPLWVTTTPGFLEHMKSLRLDRLFDAGAVAV